MKIIWNWVDGLFMNSDAKNKLFFLLLIGVNAVIGAGLWILFGRFFLPGLAWLFCFMGYPAAFIGGIGGIIYLYNHEFH